MLLSQRLKELRLQRDLTQEELALRLPINRGTYAHYELGKRQPDLETLIRIAQFYDVSTDYLLGLTDLSSSVRSIVHFIQSRPEEYPELSERGTEQVAEGSAVALSRLPGAARPDVGKLNRRQRDGRSNR